MALAAERWAITGAAGQIGSVLRAALAGEVAELRSIDVRPVGDHASNESAIVADIGDLDALVAALRGMDGVIHLAAYPSEEDLHDIARVNIVGTFHLFEAARRVGVSRVVFASSNHATGYYSVETYVDPDMPVRPDSFYGVSKVAGEAVGQLYADKFGLKVACLRIGTFAELPSERRHLATWASHADTVRAFRAAMEAPDLGFATFYVVSDNRHGFWDRSAGERVGFRPEDHAESFDPIEVGATYEHQGGPYTSADYTSERQR